MMKRLAARKGRFKALFDNQLQTVLFPRSFERGPIEAFKISFCVCLSKGISTFI